MWAQCTSCVSDDVRRGDDWSRHAVETELVQSAAVPAILETAECRGRQHDTTRSAKGEHSLHKSFPLTSSRVQPRKCRRLRRSDVELLANSANSLLQVDSPLRLSNPGSDISRFPNSRQLERLRKPLTNSQGFHLLTVC